MNSFILKGNFIDSTDTGTLRIRASSCLVCEEGHCTGVFHTLPEQYSGLPVTDYGDRLIIPGMTDLHIHASQFAYRGLGMDMELLEWLETYAFPEETKFADLAYADKAYDIVVHHLRQSATTRAAIFGTVHSAATQLLMDKMEASGLVSYVGKVNMDRNCPDTLREKSAEASLADTEAWICGTLDRYTNTKPILTPRFIPSCTDALMRGLGDLAEKYNLPVQSHLSENHGEIAWVKELCPDAAFYGAAYDRFGLFGGNGRKCIMAHCVHSSAAERELIKRNNVTIAHSPLSNSNVVCGAAPISNYLAEGLNVGLSSDVAGGETENLFASIAEALRVSKLRWRLYDQNVPVLNVEQVFSMATRRGGSFFGKVGAFEPGYELDALVLDDTRLEHPQELPLRSRLERMLYLSDEREIVSKYVRGKKLF